MIVVNDSGEPSPRFVSERAEVITTSGRTGEGNARAVGLAAVTTEWVAFCDDDDLWSENKLARQFAMLGDQQTWCITGATEIDASGTQIGVRSLTFALGLQQQGRLLPRLLTHNTLASGNSSLLVNADFLRSAGGWNAKMSYFADWDCWIRLYERAEPVLLPDLLTSYRTWPGQMVSDRRAAWIALDQIRNNHATIRAQNGIGPLDDRVIVWILSGELQTPGRRVAGTREALRRLRPRRLRDLRAVPRFVGEIPEYTMRRLRPRQLE